MSIMSRHSLEDIANTHRGIAEWLDEYTSLLEPLTYDPMFEKHGSARTVRELGYIMVYTSDDRITVHIHGGDERELMRTLRKGIGGKWEKEAGSYYFSLEREIEGSWGGVFTVSLQANRDSVCEKVVTGTKEVTYDAIPARTVVEEEIDWVCGNILED